MKITKDNHQDIAERLIAAGKLIANLYRTDDTEDDHDDIAEALRLIDEAGFGLK